MSASSRLKLSRRGVLKAGLGSAALANLVHCGLAADAKRPRPNVLFLMGDQHRGDCLGADGNVSFIDEQIELTSEQTAHRVPWQDA
ncbi:MAG: hypothetical protein NTW96_17080 [Planctomycetia bacterium]|nr:hypothetical protein [Planctomycetia bacterium]